MISGHTALYGLVAHPVHHSLSPTIHNLGFKQHQIDARYLAFDSQAPAQEVAQALRALNVAGVNLSTPYKQALLPFMDQLTPTAHLSGAINTVILHSGQLIGTNTDGDGFWRALQKAHPKQIWQEIVVLGAGGAALAVIEAAARYGVQQVHVFKRQNPTYPTVAHRLRQLATQHQITITLQPYVDLELLSKKLARADCLINATSLGMAASPGLPIAKRFIQQTPTTCLVVDLIYAPDQTAFLQLANQSGHITQNGLGMLIEQAALSFEFWTGQVLQTEPIYQTLTSIECPD
ncbi:shikimate dehydrogenase [Latilactobacillus graminis]|nr:shikimate dehydrogenase [Latilactobacillus graminis]QFP79570.1 shikimate dehydrogenase [Latilactobacillus graminis]